MIIWSIIINSLLRLRITGEQENRHTKPINMPQCPIKAKGIGYFLIPNTIKSAVSGNIKSLHTLFEYGAKVLEYRR